MAEKLKRPFAYHVRRCIHILIESVPSFLATEGIQRAAALTYYTIFAIVPIFALLFGVAKGFGLDEWFKEEMLSQFRSHDEILIKLCNFAYTTLHEARGGVVAGIGALLLCWTVIKMVGNIESAFNRVWQVKKNRSIFRKFTDYLSVLIIVPVLLMVAGSATVVVTTKLETWSEAYHISEMSLPVIEFCVKCVPLVIFWCLTGFLYLFIPNTRVKWSAAIFGGLIAGTLSFLLQNGYVYVQMALARYNAIYGSFAVLPLFLIGVNLNWLVVLFGVNLSHLFQTYDWDSVLNRDATLGKADRRLLGLLLAAETAHSFEMGEVPPSMETLAERGCLSKTMTTRLLDKLVLRNVLIPVKKGEYETSGYIPAMPLEKMTIAEVLRRLDDLGVPHAKRTMGTPLAKQLAEAVQSLANTMKNAPENVPVTKLFKVPENVPDKTSAPIPDAD